MMPTYTKPVMIQWGIELRDDRDDCPLLLGGSWFEGCVDTRKWPMRFETRREARKSAKDLESQYKYLSGHHWFFKPVQLKIIVKEL